MQGNEIVTEEHNSITLGYEKEQKIDVLLELYPGVCNLADNNRNTPVHTAVDAGKTGVVKMLVPKSDKLNRCNLKGETAFSLACKTSSKVEIVKYLI